MNRFFLDCLDLQWFKLLIEDLAQVHDNALVDLLPQVSSEDLDKRDLQGWNLPVHKNTSQIQLHLETDVDVCAVDRRTPPKCKATVRNLVQTGTLCICQFLMPHRLLETRCLLPEQTYHEIRDLADHHRMDGNSYLPKSGSTCP